MKVQLLFVEGGVHVAVGAHLLPAAGAAAVRPALRAAHGQHREEPALRAERPSVAVRLPGGLHRGLRHLLSLQEEQRTRLYFLLGLRRLHVLLLPQFFLGHCLYGLRDSGGERTATGWTTYLPALLRRI